MPTLADVRRHRRRRFSGRDPDEHHRAATPLELLYDLTIVVAFGTAADELAHFVADDHVARRHRRLRVRRVRGQLGVGELLVVRVGLRHRRLGLPPGDDGADGRRDRALARPAADVRVDRPRRHARQRRDGRRATSSCASRWSSCGGRSRATTRDARARARAPTWPRSASRRSAGSLLAIVDLPGRARRSPCCSPLLVAFEIAGPFVAERKAQTPWHAAPHRRALRPAGDHHARRGDHRHGRRAQRASSTARRAGPSTPRCCPRRRRPHVRLLVDVLRGPLGRAARPPPRARLHLRLRAPVHLRRAGRDGRRACTSPPTPSRARRRSATVAIVLSVAIPFAVFAAAFYVLYSLLMRAHDPFHLGLIAATAACWSLSVVLAAAGRERGGLPARARARARGDGRRLRDPRAPPHG